MAAGYFNKLVRSTAGERHYEADGGGGVPAP
jgi:hypothetical protein